MADEKGNRAAVDSDSDRLDALNRFRSAASISMTPELFEKLYLSPQSKVKGQLRDTFGNPTPIALVGFLMALTPLSCNLMNWRGASGNGAATIPVYFFQGGILMTLGGLLEWILGNSFPAVVFCSFGTFWLSYGGVLNPSFAAFSSYAAANEAAAEGLQTTGFNASLGFWFLFMGMLCVVFLICSLRTNVVFFTIFLSLIIAFGLLTGAFWALADDFAGNAHYANKLLVVRTPLITCSMFQENVNGDVEADFFPWWL
ncbi:gpr1 [Trichoderma arundinaceum]|uniref:Gpr1 n=1 Tax=Trichoderma arundinaceum TaxID=490622 RepID=A0A395NVV8_TRIAR|nr:gpr1 [Trichoderma arundinaceum]